MHQVWTVCRAVAAAAALVSCWSGVAAAQADKMTFRIGVQSDLKFLDPIVTPSRVTSQFANSVYETLFNQDINGVPRPQMVGDYKVSDDKLTYTFTLRPGLKWHSGGKVTSADVVVSLKRWMGFDPVGRKLNEFTASLEAVDADTFKLTLKRPYGLVLQSFAKPSPGSPFIMPERLARNPLNRALRIDKLTVAALEATLHAYEAGDALTTIPTLRMLTESPAEIRNGIGKRFTSVIGVSM